MKVSGARALAWAFVFYAYGCGGGSGGGLERPEKSGSDATVEQDSNTTVATSANMLDLDPNSMTDVELQTFIGQLKSRDIAERQEYSLLTGMNKELCDRLQRLRSECAASVRILDDGSEKILGCSGSYQNNTAIKHNIELTVSGAYHLLANKSFKSTSVDSTTSSVTFTSEKQGAVLAPRFLDLTSLRLVPTNGGELAEASATGFKLTVDESVLFEADDLVPNDLGYFDISPQKVFEMQKDESCKVEYTEVEEIKNRVVAALGGRTQQTQGSQPQGAAAATQTQQPQLQQAQPTQ